jgi:hypothetical protein
VYPLHLALEIVAIVATRPAIDVTGHSQATVAAYVRCRGYG